MVEDRSVLEQPNTGLDNRDWDRAGRDPKDPDGGGWVSNPIRLI